MGHGYTERTTFVTRFIFFEIRNDPYFFPDRFDQPSDLAIKSHTSGVTNTFAQELLISLEVSYCAAATTTTSATHAMCLSFVFIF